MARRTFFAIVGIIAAIMLLAAITTWIAARVILMSAVDFELVGHLERAARGTQPVHPGAPPPQDEMPGHAATSVPPPIGELFSPPGPPGPPGPPQSPGWPGPPPFDSPPPQGAPPLGHEHGVSPPIPLELRHASQPQRVMAIHNRRDGSVVIQSPGLPDNFVLPEPGQAVTMTIIDGRTMRWSTVDLNQPPPWLPHLVGWTSERDQYPALRAGIGIDLARTYSQLNHLALALAGLWIAATTIAGFAAWSLLPVILGPLRRVSDGLAQLGSEDLSGRIDGQGPIEVQNLIHQLNGALGRLEQGYLREKSSLSALAHELRTPVTALRTTIEFRKLDPLTESEREYFDRLLHTTTRMQSLVINLLLLSRIEAGREPLHLSACDLGDLLIDAIAETGGGIDLDCPDQVEIITSPEHIRILLANLLSNALAHRWGVGRITAAIQPGPILVVSNPCDPTLELGHLSQASPKRAPSHSGHHSGLGLPLCHRLMRLLGGTLDIEITEGRFIVSARFPIGRSAGSSNSTPQPPTNQLSMNPPSTSTVHARHEETFHNGNP